LPLKIATELVLTGEMYPASVLAAHGLINQVVASGEALQTALGMARSIAANGPMAVAVSKRCSMRASTGRAGSCSSGRTKSPLRSLSPRMRARVPPPLPKNVSPCGEVCSTSAVTPPLDRERIGTLWDVLSCHAGQRPNAVAVQFNERRQTYHELLRRPEGAAPGTARALLGRLAASHQLNRDSRKSSRAMQGLYLAGRWQWREIAVRAFLLAQRALSAVAFLAAYTLPATMCRVRLWRRANRAC
jgi:hypothetical protein